MNAPNIDPVIFGIGPLQIRWYGLMYVVGFTLAIQVLKKLTRSGFFQVAEEKVDSLFTHVVIYMFLGARLTYVFIYNWDYYQNHLMELLAVWQGGLSFHGALIGILLGGLHFSRKNGISWGQTMDCIALGGAPELFFGRMGNFINGELYGRVTDSPFGMIFQGAGPYPRHPSQLYEAFAEGILLSIILWAMKSRVKNYGAIGCMFVVGYGFFRYFIEFFRQPDAQLGYYFGGTTTMGQILCLIMVVGGLVALKLNAKRDDPILAT